MKLMTMLSFMLNFTFMMTKQPIKMIVIIITQTIMMTYMMTKESNSPWFAYILMITFISGMMVLFTYITSITPNEPEKMNKMILTALIIMSIIMFMINIKMENTFNPPKWNINNSENYIQMTLTKMFNTNSSIMFIIMMMYLFIVLIVVNKISNMEKGPLRKKN
uniref:NADH dehydrogenase subunit 6 n=1 Tax=Trachytettix bufo TaxID=1260748 RepID=M4JDT1_9ORTH|nr:NADH dehydrogenase subunit 6 [Trachytettix bufo]